MFWKLFGYIMICSLIACLGTRAHAAPQAESSLKTVDSKPIPAGVTKTVKVKKHHHATTQLTPKDLHKVPAANTAQGKPRADTSSWQERAPNASWTKVNPVSHGAGR